MDLTTVFIQFKICGVLVIIGVWLRYLLTAISGSFSPILVPSFFLALLYPFFLNGISKVACTWFGDK